MVAIATRALELIIKIRGLLYRSSGRNCNNYFLIVSIYTAKTFNTQTTCEMIIMKKKGKYFCVHTLMVFILYILYSLPYGSTSRRFRGDKKAFGPSKTFFNVETHYYLGEY